MLRLAYACLPVAGLLQWGGLGAASQDALLPGAQRQRQCPGSQLRPVDARDGCLCVRTASPMHPWLAWICPAGAVLLGPCGVRTPAFVAFVEASAVQG